MKIKTKVEMNLPQLIEYAWDKDVRGKVYPCVDFESKSVTFNSLGWAEFSDEFSYNPTDTFTIEVEEEITLTTPLPAMLHVWKTGILGTEIMEVENKSIASQYTVCSTEFWLKEDNEMTLIWRNGKMVE